MRTRSLPPRIPGYRLGDPLGFGSGGPVWAGRAPDGRLVAVRVVRLDEPLVAAYRARLAAVRGGSHPHLGGVSDVLSLDQTTTAVIGPVVPGPTLAALQAAREPLTAGEVRTLVAQVGSALAHLHALGVVHGDVSPANVVATPSGWVLVDVAGFAPGEGGTVGFVAPERRAGRPPSAPADVWSLAEVAAWTGAPLPDAVQRARTAEPGRRPSARELATLDRDADTAGPRIPSGDLLAQASLRAAALAAPTASLRGRRRTGRRRLAAVCASGAGRHRAASRTRTALGRLAGGAAVALLVASVLIAGRPEPGAPRSVEGALSVTARALVAARDEALGAGDVEGLRAITVPGSAARGQDERLWARAEAAGARFQGLRTDVVDAAVIGSATVAVEVRQLGHVRVVGGEPRSVPPQPRRCLVLRIAATPDGSRIAGVDGCR